MKKERKKILKVQPLYSIIICFVIAVCGCLMLFLPEILSWENSETFTQIIYYTISIVFVVLGLIFALRYMEYAVIDGDRIIIRNPFCVIISFKNDEIKSINIQNLTTYASRGFISLQWIVIKINDYAMEKSRLNKKRNSFCQIVASSKNISFLKRYANHYHIPFE